LFTLSLFSLFFLHPFLSKKKSLCLPLSIFLPFCLTFVPLFFCSSLPPSSLCSGSIYRGRGSVIDPAPSHHLHGV
jgi:hypothetical protein